MKIQTLHRWDVTPAEARDIQLRLRDLVECRDRLPRIRRVAGADVALQLGGPRSWQHSKAFAIAGAVVYRFPQMEEIERVSVVKPLTFPYIPGLLSFREIPALLGAFEMLRNPPDLIFCDAHGYAHPRRFGLACHLGVLLGLPSIGVAKSRYIGEHGDPASSAGSTKPLLDPKSGEEIGAVVRTAAGVRPIYISQGHRISLSRAVALTLAVTDGYRIPRPTRDADQFVNSIRRKRKPPAGKVQPRS
jgi:deoxyribonuclease V